MARFLAYCTLIAFFTCTGATIAGEEGPSSTVSELKVLDHYVGSWDVTVTSQGAPFTNGQATAQWILDGRFLQQTGALSAKDGSTGLEFTQLMTYDPGKKIYRSWTFLSDGSTSESEATWDAKAQIMTSVSRKDERGGTSTTTADFSEAGIEKWRIVYTDRTGIMVSEMSGKNTLAPITFMYIGRSGGTAEDCREASSSDGKVVLKVEGPKSKGTVRLYAALDPWIAPPDGESIGKLRIKRNAGGELLVEQLQMFPYAAYHDDGPDALEGAISLLRAGLRGAMEDDPEHDLVFV